MWKIELETIFHSKFFKKLRKPEKGLDNLDHFLIY